MSFVRAVIGHMPNSITSGFRFLPTDEEIGHMPNSMTPGFRFLPTEEELVKYYLWRKVYRKSFLNFQPIIEIDVYKYEPWKLSVFSPLTSTDREWYFFCLLDRKYSGGSRLNRATEQGYWKSDGNERFVRHKSHTIGIKKTLIFYVGRAPDGNKTNWVMHEYRLDVDEEIENGIVAQDAFVLCRIFEKRNRYAPFVEEWENDVPTGGGEADDDMPHGDEPMTGFINEPEVQDKQKCPMFPEENFESSSQNIDFMFKKLEESDDLEFLSLGPSKRSKQYEPNSSNENGSDDSTTTSRGPLHHAKRKESQLSNLLDSSNLEKLVPPGYLKLINNLENDILDGSRERETLKLKVRRAEAMINTLLTRNEFLRMKMKI